MDESLAWVKPYETDFPFSMQNSKGCAQILEDPSVLQNVARATIQDWQQRRQKATTPMSSAMVEASQTWRRAMTACHGPTLPAGVEPALTLRSFTDGFAKCGDPQSIQKGAVQSLFGGEWCVGDWRHYLRPAFASTWWRSFGSSAQQQLEEKFVDSARCALHLEFPLEKTTASSITPATIRSAPPKQRSPDDWRPKRTILLALTMGRAGSTMACKLVTTAYPRGWEVVLVEGNYHGYKHKYTYALKALQVLLREANDDISASETLVVFADAKDVLVQVPAEDVVESFRQQPYDFVFSSEPLCFPLGTWPHSLGIPHHACGGGNLYPETSTGIVRGRKFVNTGGWIGLASSAVVVLKEMVGLVQHRPKDAVCHSWGTDQLLGNAAFLRYSSSLMGLDTDYAVFASGAWELVRDEVLQYDAGSQAFCRSQSSETTACPGMLHFNGGGDEGGSFQQAYETLTSPESLPTCHAGGSVSVVNIDNGSLRILGDRRQGIDNFLGAAWKKCLANKPCFG